MIVTASARRCADMSEVRAEVDRMDREIAPLLAERCRHVIRVGHLKKALADSGAGIPVGAPGRVAAVIDKVRGLAVEAGGNPDLIERIWRAWIDALIAYEHEIVDDRDPGVIAPSDAATLEEARAGIDALDRVLVPMFCERGEYVRQAAQYKPTRADVVVDWRVEDVVEKAKKLAEPLGNDPVLVEALYRPMVDAMIWSEEQEWDRLHP